MEMKVEFHDCTCPGQWRQSYIANDGSHGICDGGGYGGYEAAEVNVVEVAVVMSCTTNFHLLTGFRLVKRPVLTNLYENMTDYATGGRADKRTNERTADRLMNMRGGI